MKKDRKSSFATLEPNIIIQSVFFNMSFHLVRKWHLMTFGGKRYKCPSLKF